MNKIIGTLIMLMPFIGMTYQDSTMRCVNLANDITRPKNIPANLTGLLCNGASNRVAPVLCYKEAIKLTKPRLGTHNAVSLCSGAQTMDKNELTPIKCYRAVKNALGAVNMPAAVTICSQATDMTPFRCAEEVKASKNLKMDWAGAAALCTQGFLGM